MPHRTRFRSGSQPEFEVEYYTKELGPELQREMLKKQLARLGENSAPAARHGEDITTEPEAAPPQDDRAG